MPTITDPSLVFTVMVALTLAAPLLAEKLRIPDMVLLLMAGTIMGPHGLGLLERGPAILVFSSVGLLYIMFLAGLEIDLHQFVQARKRSIIFGLLTFIIPQGIGTLLGRYALMMDWNAAILLASMFASHTLLAYPVASRLGLVRSEPVAVTIGATIITDILALLVLAVIADAAKGIELDFFFWVSIAFSLATLIAVGWWGIPWLSRWFFRNNSENGGAQFLFVLGVVCAFSYASHFARMEPIIGAFLAGMAFNRMIPRQSTLMNRIGFVGTNLFIPFFLISVGMLVNPIGLLQSSQSWVVIATMVCGVISTKYAAAQVARILFGYGHAEGNVMFGLSVVQAAATLAAVLVGYQLKIFDESVLNGAIAMIMVTCPLGSWAVDTYGRQMVVQVVPEEQSRQSEMRILIPVADVQGSTKILDLVFVLQDRSKKNILQPITIIPDEGDTAVALTAGEKIMAHCLAHAAAAEMAITPSVRIGLNVSDGIINTAKEMRADLVVLGWGSDKGMTTRVFGSIKKQITQECPSRILICRLVMPLNTTQRLLVPLPPNAARRSDFFDLLQESERLAAELGANLHIIPSDSESRNFANKIFERKPPTASLTLGHVQDWNILRETLLGDIEPDDMILLPVERRLGGFWTPSLDRLPELIVARYPAINVLAAYPAWAKPFQPVDYAAQETAQSLAQIIPISLRGTTDLNRALLRMVDEVSTRTSQDHQELLRLLHESVSAYPVEMAAGIVLLHAHSNAVGTPTLLLGVGNDQIKCPNLDNLVRMFLVLISPKDKSPEMHLAALSQLARAFRDTEFAAKLQEITEPRQAVVLFKQKIALLEQGPKA